MSLTGVKNMEEQGIDVEKIRGDFQFYRVKFTVNRWFISTLRHLHKNHSR